MIDIPHDFALLILRGLFWLCITLIAVAATAVGWAARRIVGAINQAQVERAEIRTYLSDQVARIDNRLNVEFREMDQRITRVEAKLGLPSVGDGLDGL